MYFCQLSLPTSKQILLYFIHFKYPIKGKINHILVYAYLKEEFIYNLNMLFQDDRLQTPQIRSHLCT